jgi:bacteriorhodopsin
MQHSQLLARGLTGSQTYTSFQWDLVFFALFVAGFALFAAMIYSIVTRSEISKKYRPAVVASGLICGVATLAYLLLILSWKAGFRLEGESFVPNPGFRFSNGFRYADWTVTVPLLCAELLAVCSLTGSRARNLRFRAMAAAFLMIVTGFIGNELNEGAKPNTSALLIWGGVSTVFYLYLYVGLFGAVRESLPTMSTPAATSLRNATILLFSVWGTYPVVYLIFAFSRSSVTWAIAAQLAFCAADILAKAGFGSLIHKVAKLRTAEDAAKGEETLPDIYPEEVYLSHEKLSVPRHPLLMADAAGSGAAAANGADGSRSTSADGVSRIR